MRIVQLVENLDVGGLERFAIQLSAALVRAGHSVSMYCLYEPGALASEAEAAGVPVRAFRKRRGFSPGTLWEIRTALRADTAAVIHGHNPGVHHYGALAGKLAGVRTVVSTRHGVSTSFGQDYQERYFRWMLPLTSAVVFVSDDARWHYQQRGLAPPSKTVVIHNGIDLEPFRFRRAEPGGRRPRFRFGTIGRMVPVKGHALLLDAFAELRRHVPGAELDIVGGGPLRAKLEQQVARLGLAEAVRLRLPCDDVAGILAGWDVFVLSSGSEGLPMVMLEALAAGLPIVSTRVGGVEEVAPEHEVAWYCRPGEASELAAVMREAAGSPDLDKKSEAARALAFKRYGIDAVARRYESVYRGCLR